LAHASRALSAAALLLVLAVPAAPSVSAQASDARFFTQTGFRIDNDAFWDQSRASSSWTAFRSRSFSAK